MIDHKARTSKVLQCIFDLSTFDLRKFFDLKKNFTVPKILVHKMFDLRKIFVAPKDFPVMPEGEKHWGGQ